MIDEIENLQINEFKQCIGLDDPVIITWVNFDPNMDM